MQVFGRVSNSIMGNLYDNSRTGNTTTTTSNSNNSKNCHNSPSNSYNVDNGEDARKRKRDQNDTEKEAQQAPRKKFCNHNVCTFEEYLCSMIVGSHGLRGTNLQRKSGP